MGNAKGSQTIGYKYFLGVDLGWCHGPVDCMTGVWVDNKKLTDSSTTDKIHVDQPELFGEFEGGVAGIIDLYQGDMAETQDPYLLGLAEWDSTTLPAYRGICRTVLKSSDRKDTSRGFYVGNNPYLKRVTAEFQRIYKRIVDGVAVDNWQVALAGVPLINPEPNRYEGIIEDQTVFINVDLSSAANGYAGEKAPSEAGAGMTLEGTKASVIKALLLLRENFAWETEVTTSDILNTEVANSSGLNLGVGYFRYTTGTNNNTSNNPDGVDPAQAPSLTSTVPSTIDYNLPKRGYKFFEGITRSQIDELIAFVTAFVVVPDTIADGAVQDFGMYVDNLVEAMATIPSDTKPRSHTLYSGFVTNQDNYTLAYASDTLNTALSPTGYDGSYEPVKIVVGPTGISALSTGGDSGFTGGATSPNITAIYFGATFINTYGTTWSSTELGGWYIIDVGTSADGPPAQEWAGDLGVEIGDDQSTGIPSGTAANYTQVAPGPTDYTWWQGRLFTTGIYALGDRFKIDLHLQRDTIGASTFAVTSADGSVRSSIMTYVETEDAVSALFGGIVEVGAGLGDGSTLTGAGLMGMGMGGCASVDEMNPAHIIRECLTDQQWGLGLPDADIDEVSFLAAAQALYDERFGMSIAWTQEGPIEDFVQLVLNHIDAVLFVDRADGLYHLVLLRNDYVIDDVLGFTDADVISWDSISIKSPAELVNSVTCKYSSRRSVNNGEASLTINNLAQTQKLGQVINTTVNYAGIWQDVLAARVAQRDLDAMSSSLIGGSISVTRKGYNLKPGSVFTLTSPRYNLSGEIMRVVEIGVGDGRQNEVKLKFVQDKFNLDVGTDTDLLDIEDSLFAGDLGQPTATQYRYTSEEPYYLFNRRIGEFEAEAKETDEPDLGFVLTTAIPPNSYTQRAYPYYDDGSGSYVQATEMPFGISAFLAEDLRGFSDRNTLTLSNWAYASDVAIGDLIIIDDEVMRIETVVSLTEITVGRGCLDTVPAYHASNSPVFFLENRGVINKQFVASDSVAVKLQTIASGGSLDLALAPIDTVVFDSRIARPYPIGDLLLDGTSTGIWDYTAASTIVATWVHRDRTLQLQDTVTDFTDASIGPEVGSDYTISAVAYDFLGQEATGDIFSTNKAQLLTETIATDAFTATTEGTDPWSVVGIRVSNTRGAYQNWQTAEAIAIVPAAPLSLSQFYGSSWWSASDLSSLTQDTLQAVPVTATSDPIGRISNLKGYLL
jgi:hypothetical protein